jgi:hypothetical protein
MSTAPMGWAKSARTSTPRKSTLGAPSVVVLHSKYTTRPKGFFYFFFVVPEWMIGVIAIKLFKGIVKVWGGGGWRHVDSLFVDAY